MAPGATCQVSEIPIAKRTNAIVACRTIVRSAAVLRYGDVRCLPALRRAGPDGVTIGAADPIMVAVAKTAAKGRSPR